MTHEKLILLYLTENTTLKLYEWKSYKKKLGVSGVSFKRHGITKIEFSEKKCTSIINIYYIEIKYYSNQT